ncbi:tudor domain-containing protein 1-like [Xenia sp. Carnegie-2017]|uniref:tudor domain-containing protein 1-like n=1 Tax=Xenia sp. Carnegie-2017 TaxID=2897299 RepID=UPI001F045080|nr:tudor domain-containing protein 1-like [Xenia sp. Carnegie-2017]
MLPRFAELNAQGFTASLVSGSTADITKAKDADEGLEVMVELLNLNNNIYEVEVHDMNGERLFKSKENVENEPGDKTIKSFSSAHNLKPSTQWDVCASHCESPMLFYLQLVKNKDILEKIMSELDDVYSHLTAEDNMITNPVIGMTCVAKYPVDNGWYRSQILDIPSPNQINVFYIDFGNCEIVDLSSVKTLAPAFYSTPVQAARCRLYGAEEKTWSESECEMFEGLVLEKHLIAEVKSLDGDETTLIVDLFDTSGTENVRIFDELVKKSSTTKASGQRNLLKLSSLPKLGLKDVEDVFVESAESLDNFVCQLSRFNNNIETLADMMYDTYQQETAPDFVSTPLQVDDVIAALYSEDETWYRASVSKHINDGDIEVMFIDYGNSEIIPKSEIGKEFVI